MAFGRIQKFSVLVTVISLLVEALANPVVRNDNFQLTILHNNDMHARFVETDTYSNKCAEDAAINHKCFGGFARVSHLVRKYRNESDNVLYLNAGDTYTGTPWFSLFTSNITTEMMNILQPDAISLGNHEFDEGVAGLVPFLRNVHFPVLAANLDLSKTPEMQNLPQLKNSQVFTKGGRKIGVIGYLTPDTKNLVAAMTVEFTAEIAAINAEAEKLAAEGVNIIVALGHSGVLQDQNIAMNCPLIDLVIGGHSHTFLYSGVADGGDIPYGPYPITITQSSGKKVPVVQAYAYTKYLGVLSLEFDEAGNLIFYEGKPLLLDAEVPQDDDVVRALDVYRSDVEMYENTIVGQTKVILQGDNCRKEECNFGNLLTDAMVHMRAGLYSVGDDNRWTDAAIAFLQGGGIRSSIDTVTSGNGDISMGELDTVLPFKNKYMVIEVTGKVLKEALEYSISNYDKDIGTAAFLQVSGVHVSYNLDKPVNERIEDLQVLCADCDVPRYQEVDEQKSYGLIISDFLKEGGDGFTMFIDSKIIFEFPANDIDTTVEFIKNVSPVYPPVESRTRLGGAASLVNISLLLLVATTVLNLIR